MTVNEFSRLAYCSEPIQVESAYNGKVLCKRFNANNHIGIGNREIVGFRSSIRITKEGTYACPITIVSVKGDIEYEREHNQTQSKKG